MIVNNIQDNQINESNTTEELSNSLLLESIEAVSISNPSESITETASIAETTITEPKKDIMNHLKQSNGDFSYFSAEQKERSSKIREHIQKSLS